MPHTRLYFTLPSIGGNFASNAEHRLLASWNPPSAAMLPGIAFCIPLFRAALAAANSASAGVVTVNPEARLVELLATGRGGGAKTDIAAYCELQGEPDHDPVALDVQ